MSSGNQVSTILAAITSGLGTGSAYALLGLGLTLILAASGVFNLAQSSVVLGGSLATYGLYQILHWPILLAVAIVAAGGAIAGFVSYWGAVGFIFKRPGIAAELTEATLVTTLGLYLAFGSIMTLSFGADVYPVRSYVSSEAHDIGGVPIQPIYVVMLVVTIVIVIAIETFTRRSKAGLFLRMTFEDSEGAEMQGVSVRRVIMISFAVAGVLAAIGGLMIVPVTSASTSVADSFGLYGFAAMAIGGYGSFVGALIGGLIVGVIEALVPVWFNVQLAPLIVYALLIGVLVIRPRGLFGRAGAFGASSLREV